MNDKEILIKVDGLSKKFCKDLKTSLKYGIKDVFTEITGRSTKTNLRDKEFWAIQDISFEVRRGECLGLIGHNGAGKSTLLKILNGLIRPDKGSVEMNGRVGALIELGAGFNPILTGRENIYNNAAVLGFQKKEIDASIEEIIDFSEIRDFIDSPVQYYSSGMKVRLGFAVAAQVQPDILLIDEVLAVGDIGFVLKCFNRIDELLKNTAIIFVSHGMAQVARICSKILLMDKGKSVLYTTDVAQGVTTYYNQFKLEIGNYIGSDKANLEEVKIKVDEIWIDSDDITINYGEPLSIRITIKAAEIIVDPKVYLAFYDKEQRNFAEVFNFSDVIHVDQLNSGISVFEVTLPELQFTQGKYSITVALSGKDQSIFRFQSAIYFTVHGDTHGWAPMQLLPNWKILK